MSKPIVQHLLAGKVKKVGKPDATNPMDKEWESGMFKEKTHGKLWLTKTGLEGDEVADTKNHGGLQKAIFAYPIEHYDYWRSERNIAMIDIGGMGENLAIRHSNEESICIGDTYQFGEAIIQVSQPRTPCWKPARRFRSKDLTLQIQDTGRTGWYFRVLKEGFVQEGEELTLLERPHPEWTVALCNEIMFNKEQNDLVLLGKLVDCVLLSESWKGSLRKRLVKITEA